MEDAYAAAMLESDGTSIQQRVERAATAIRVRLKELSETSVVGAEQMELESALDYLRRLKANLGQH
jgi:hypothetical protein